MAWRWTPRARSGTTAFAAGRIGQRRSATRAAGGPMYGSRPRRQRALQQPARFLLRSFPSEHQRHHFQNVPITTTHFNPVFLHPALLPGNRTFLFAPNRTLLFAHDILRARRSAPARRAGLTQPPQESRAAKKTSKLPYPLPWYSGGGLGWGLRANCQVSKMIVACGLPTAIALA